MTFFDSVFPSNAEMFFTDLLFLKYFAAFLGVFLAAGLTLWCIRKIADFIILAVLIGAFLIVCYRLTNGSVSTWEELAGISIALGVGGSIVCIPVLPFSSMVGNGMNKTIKTDR